MSAAETPADPRTAATAGRGAWILAALVLVYVGFRAVLLHGAFEAVALPTYELHNMGNLARLLSVGAEGPPLWMHFDNAGGQQLTAMLAAPLYALFGPSYLVLKLVPMGLGLVALLLLWVTMRREYGLAAATVSGALFVLGPPTLVKYSVLASGNHFENVVFALALFALFAAGHRGERGRWLPLALGLVAGLSLFVYPGAVVPVAAFALLQLGVRGLRGALADLPAALGGVALGLAPLLAFNLASDGRSLRFASRNLAGDVGPLERLAHNADVILGDLLPRAGCYEPLAGASAGLAEGLGLAAYLASAVVVGAGLVAGLRRLGSLGERSARWQALRGAALLHWLPLFVLFIGFGRWDFDAYEPPLQVGQFRYFVPHFTFAAALGGAAVANLRARGGAARALSWVLCLALLTPSLFTLPIARPWPGTAGAGLAYEGHHFPYYGRILLAYTERDELTQELLPDLDQLHDWLDDMPRRHALDTWSGVAHVVTSSRLAPRGRLSATPAAAVALPPWDGDGEAGTGASLAGSPRVDPGGKLDLGADLGTDLGADLSTDLGPDPGVALAWARGVGSCLRPMASGDEPAREALRRLLALLERDGHPLAGWVVEGLAWEYQVTVSREVERQLATTFACAELVPPSRRDALLHGMGAQLGRLAARGIPADVQRVQVTLEQLPSPSLEAVARGLGWGLAEVAGAETWVDVLDAQLPPATWLAASQGAGACRRHLDGASAAPPAALDAARRAAFDQGVRRQAGATPWWERP